MSTAVPSTLIDLLRAAADGRGGTVQSFYMLDDQGGIGEKLTHAELDARARGVAATLQTRGFGPKDAALLLYPPGLEFVCAFFGCLYAGVLPVPVYPPNPARLGQTLPRLRTIAKSSDAKVILTSSSIHAASSAIFPLAPELASHPWIATDTERVDAADWRPHAVRPDDVALVQYTSGSTRDARGVVLTHANLVHNQKLIASIFAPHEDPHPCAVTWLPVYHDMGLIGKVLGSLATPCDCWMMSPLDFLRHPLRWLSTISTHRGTMSAGPNFAYDLCARKITDAEIAQLDLSSWRVAINGAEPVRKATLERFAKKFAPAGFKRSAFVPSYGLAEASLLVSAATSKDGPTSMDVSDAALREGRITPGSGDDVRSLVGVGPAVGDQEVRIVDAKGVTLASGEIGEVWVRGQSVGRGYWGKPAETEEVFQARTAEGDGPFLRTGDLGFMSASGELFILGRSKDLIIVRGLNHYPQDIEATVEGAAAGLRAGCAAAFALERGDSEAVVVVCEYAGEGSEGWAGVVDAVRAAVGEHHEISVHAVALVARGQVPKTSSGKVMRSRVRDLFLDGSLEVLHTWVAEENDDDASSDESDVGPLLSSVEEITELVVRWLCSHLGRSISASDSFASMGIDSLDAVRLMDHVSRRVGKETSPTLLLDCPTTEELAVEVARGLVDK